MLEKFKTETSPKLKSLKLLYSLIRKLGPVRINTLTELTGLKHVTCTRLLDELYQEGLIYDSGIGESSGGRKPIMYVIKPDAHYIVGIEITPLSATALLMDLDLDIIGTENLQLESNDAASKILNLVALAIEKLLSNHQIPKVKLLGIGVGFFEPVDKNSGTLMNPQLFHASDWAELNINEFLQKRFHTSIILDNATNLAALAQYRKNYWKETDNLVFVSNDAGIRSGAIFQGKLVNEKAEMDDAFGHMIVDMHGRRCQCGSYGCLQTYCSLSAIRDEVVRQLKRGRPSSLQVMDAEEIKLHHILNALKEEDSLCIEAMKDAAYYFGLGLSNLIFLLRPDIVICGGALVSEPQFYQLAAETAHKRLMNYPTSPVRIIMSADEENIVALGAGYMVFDEFTEEQ